MARAPQHKTLAPLQRVSALGTLANLFVDYLPLSLHLVQPGKPGIWHSLASPTTGLHPVQFEIFLKTVNARYAFHTRCLAKAQRSAAPFHAEHRGLWDCVAPSGVESWAVFAGPYLDHLPDASELRKRFAQLSGGRKTAPEVQIAYCRSVLETPVLDPAAQSALAVACSFAASWHLRGQGPAAEAIESLKPTLARSVPWRMERFVEARREKLLWWAAQSQGLAEWDVRDFGLSKMPGAVLALAPTASGVDAVEDLVQAARLRQAAFKFAVDHSLIVGRSLGEGACLLSPVVGSSKRAVDALADLGRAAGAALSKSLGAPVSVGWSLPLDGEQLPDAFRQAEWALMMALPKGQRYLAYEAGQGGGDAALDNYEAGQALLRAIVSGRHAELSAAKDAALGGVARLFPGRSDLLRPELLRLSLQIFDALRVRALLEEPVWIAQRLEALAELQEARSARELAAAFSALVERLGRLSVAPHASSARLRVTQTARKLRSQVEAPDLRGAAAQAGLSPSRFSRLYRGEAGEGFGEQRRRKRLETAAQLLRQGRLPIWRVAQECGYRSASHFSQAFKLHFGSGPAQYRRQGSR